MMLKKSAAILAAAGLSHAAVETNRPNVVLINVDDLGWSDLSCQGSDFYKTPNIDKLAEEGMVFSNAYAAAANCAPSRACLLTGQNTPRHGVYTVGNSDRGNTVDRRLIPIKNRPFIEVSNLTFGSFFKKAGYATASMGKWHVSHDPTKHGFDLNVGGSHQGGPYKGGYHSPYNYPNCTEKEKGRFLTDHLTDKAVEFIRINSRAAKPFFLYFPYYAVHAPLQGKKEKVERFRKAPKGRVHHSAVYAALLESVDENVGRLMGALKTAEAEENTVVIFTSDNGGVWKHSKQWPLRAGKGAYYEGGIREPFIVKWPRKIKAGRRSDVPISQLDVFPTLLDIAGINAAGKVLDGVNIMPLLTGEGEIDERALYWHFPIYLEAYAKVDTETRDPKFRTRPGSAIRYGDWKLHEYFEDGGLELYNLKDDMGEKSNMAEAHPEVAAKLHQMLKNWRKKMKAPVPSTLNPKYRKRVN